jgi:hypothetical protein
MTSDYHLPASNLKYVTFFKKAYLKTRLLARHQWLTSVVLATQEAEIKRIMV